MTAAARWVAVLPLAACACLPTLQTPTVRPGLGVDVGATYVTDQTRNDEPQTYDLFGYVAPFVGLSDKVEVGFPVGWYLEEGWNSLSERESFGTDPVQFLILPYVKTVAKLSDRDRLGFVLQSVLFVPASVGVLYGHDFDDLTTHAGLRWIFSPGPAGDDPAITRYQEKDQLLLAFTVGVETHGRGRLAVEIGGLLNSYAEGAVFGDFGQPTERRTLVDLFVGTRLRWQ